MLTKQLETTVRFVFSFLNVSYLRCLQGFGPLRPSEDLLHQPAILTVRTPEAKILRLTDSGVTQSMVLTRTPFSITPVPVARNLLLLSQPRSLLVASHSRSLTLWYALYTYTILPN